MLHLGKHFLWLAQKVFNLVDSSRRIDRSWYCTWDASTFGNKFDQEFELPAPRSFAPSTRGDGTGGAVHLPRGACGSQLPTVSRDLLGLTKCLFFFFFLRLLSCFKSPLWRLVARKSKTGATRLLFTVSHQVRPQPKPPADGATRPAQKAHRHNARRLCICYRQLNQLRTEKKKKKKSRILAHLLACIIGLARDSKPMKDWERRYDSLLALLDWLRWIAVPDEVGLGV